MLDDRRVCVPDVTPEFESVLALAWAVGNKVGVIVGVIVGVNVGASVGDTVEGACVGARVGPAVGDGVGVVVGAAVPQVDPVRRTTYPAAALHGHTYLYERAWRCNVWSCKCTNAT